MNEGCDWLVPEGFNFGDAKVFFRHRKEEIKYGVIRSVPLGSDILCPPYIIV